MSQNLQDVIAKCVLGNVQFSGKVGTIYTVQDLVHNVNLVTINDMYQRTQKQLKETTEESLFTTSSSKKNAVLQLQGEALKEIFLYKQEEAKKASEAEKTRKKKQEKLAALKNIHAEKELEALGKMSLEDVEKEIELLENQ